MDYEREEKLANLLDWALNFIVSSFGKSVRFSVEKMDEARALVAEYQGAFPRLHQDFLDQIKAGGFGAEGEKIILDLALTAGSKDLALAAAARIKAKRLLRRGKEAA